MKYKLKIIYKKIFICFFIITFLLSSSAVFADDIEYPEDVDYLPVDSKNEEIIETSVSKGKELNLNSRSCIVYDRTSKHILYGKNEYNKVKMASTTKIMTAIIVIENSNLNETVEVSKKAANTGGSRLGLKTGDKITIHDLLYGLMLRSGNDAAVCLAECTAGSIQSFSKLMNQKAVDLGLVNSHFESPHGLDSDGHYTTAYELAKLSDYALNNEIFSQIVGTKNYTININGYPKNLSNTNELLGNLNGVYGVKTGFTNGANRCLVTACKRNDMDIICVVLGCDTKKLRTQDSIKLIEYAFNNFQYVNIEDLINKEFDKWKEKNMNTFTVDKGIDSNVEIAISKLEYPIIPVRKNEIDTISFSINVTTKLFAPINKNDIIGSINVYSDSSNLLNANILVSNSIQKKKPFNYLYLLLKDYPKIVINNIFY